MNLVFERNADDFLMNLSSFLTEKFEDFDVDYLDGILKITIEKKGQFVINKHSSSQKIWYSSPVSGAKYFVWNDEVESFLCQNSGKYVEDILMDDLSRYV